VRVTTDYIETWLTGLSERTKENYLREFPQWENFVKMTATQQIEKRLKDLTSKDLRERTFFEQKFRAYKEHLEKNTDLKAISVKTHLRTVASFFSRNSIPLNLKRGDWESTLETKVVHRFKLSLDDVKGMYAHANLRDRALLLVLAQSGLSEVDTIALQIEDIKDLYSMPQTEHYFLEKPREKTNIMQATCLSYEALHDIRAMLSEIGNPQEGYIFTSQTKGKGEQITTRTVNEAMKALALKTFGKEKAKQFKTKTLRSFYNSALLRSKVQPEIKDLMMGHGRKGARKHYDYDEFTIKEAYKAAFEHLSINGVQSREDLAQLKNKLAELEHKRIEDNETLMNALKGIQKENSEIKEDLAEVRRGNLWLLEYAKNLKTDKDKIAFADHLKRLSKSAEAEDNKES
jgi:integrase